MIIREKSSLKHMITFYKVYVAFNKVYLNKNANNFRMNVDVFGYFL